MAITPQQSLGGLACSMQLLEQKLIPAFLDSSQFEKLVELAAQLPAIHRAGFEHSNSSSQKGLDFQQAINLNSKEIQQILTSDAQCKQFPGLARLCKEWIRGASLFPRQWAQIWMEFDSGPTAKTEPNPIYFIGFNSMLLDAAAQWKAISNLHELLADSPVPDQQAKSLREILRTFPHGTGISHLGFLLSRPQDSIRLVLPCTHSLKLTELLQSADWAGDITAAKSICDWLFERFAEVRLCLDVGPQLSSQIGFECLFSTIQNHGSGIRGIYDSLRQAAYCTDEFADRILSWPERILPGNHNKSWPDELIAESIVDEETLFSVIDCRLSHLKFSITKHAQVTVKSYFGFRHCMITG